ncbi:MAG: tRNA epoxyqueuosine(34) reductase QueG [Acidobacteriia bacterium]|nr:tRNA epoxyqueuosine(34) reductase QueG [Terriglobia bacterium]
MPNLPDTAWINERARALGFALCGVTPAAALPELERLAEWLGRGYAGEMGYLADARRGDPARVLPGVRSIIVCALPYNTGKPFSTHVPAESTGEGPRGWISRYAWGEDYHGVVGGKLEELAAALRERFAKPFEARWYVDTGAIHERAYARHAGLGWLGKNTLLLNEQLGSLFFLGVILTTLELAPSLGAAEAPPPDLCGNCRLCLDACPTDAFSEPYVLDARRCISYLTIELRGAIPEELRESLGRHVFGCDICQEVCPWNARAPVSELNAFQPRVSGGESLFHPRLEWLAALGEEEFRELFRGSPLKRAKWRGLVRNACVALGNADLHGDAAAQARVRALLERLAASPEAQVAENARWALARMEEKASRNS